MGTLDLEDLKQKATAATPGPYRECGRDRGGCMCRLIYSSDDVVAKAYSRVEGDGEGYPEEQAKKNAAFIAAASPDVVLALIARVEYAERCERSANDTLRQLRGIIIDYGIDTDIGLP